MNIRWNSTLNDLDNVEPTEFSRLSSRPARANEIESKTHRIIVVIAIPDRQNEAGLRLVNAARKKFGLSYEKSEIGVVF